MRGCCVGTVKAVETPEEPLDALNVLTPNYAALLQKDRWGCAENHHLLRAELVLTLNGGLLQHFPGARESHGSVGSPL